MASNAALATDAELDLFQLGIALALVNRKLKEVSADTLALGCRLGEEYPECCLVPMLVWGHRRMPQH